MKILGPLPKHEDNLLLTLIKIGFKNFVFYSTTAVPHLPNFFLLQYGELWVFKRQKYLCVQAYNNK